MNKKNLIIFDIDDTLTKSQSKHVDALLFAMRFFKIENVDTDWRNYKHACDSFIFKTNYELTHKKSFSVDFMASFEEKMTECFLKGAPTTPIKGANEILDFFNNQTDYGVCFATGSIRETALLKLKQSNLPFNEELVTASNHLFSREAIVNSAIDRAKKFYNVASFNNIISFGDGLWDATTAENLGLHFVGVNDKNTQDFKKMNVKYHVSDFTSFNFEKMKSLLNIK